MGTIVRQATTTTKPIAPLIGRTKKNTAATTWIPVTSPVYWEHCA